MSTNNDWPGLWPRLRHYQVPTEMNRVEIQTLAPRSCRCARESSESASMQRLTRSPMFTAPARASQLSTLPHPSRALHGAIKFCGLRITIRLQPADLGRIFLKFPNKLQQPHVSDAKLLSPSTSRRPAGVATGPPPQRKSPDHELLFLAAPRPRRMVSLALKRFS